MIKYPLNVTIDSNVFDANKYDLADDSTLSLLVSYVEKGKIKVILSNIVVNEMSKHIQGKAYEIAAKMNNLQKDIKKNYAEGLMINVGMEHLLVKANRKELAERAISALNEFLCKLRPEMLDSSAVNVEKIFEDYFAFRPPFENNDKKRKEFPDAFIAAEIKERFKNGEQLAIISADNGFKQACNVSDSFLFFDSLGELYDAINKEEKCYKEGVEFIDKYRVQICQSVETFILENDCIDVIGMSYDKDGISEGYDYSETILESIADVDCRIHTIDEISEGQVYATIVCTAKIEVDCYYEDYDNAAWDSESKSYIYLETKQIKEKHKARFAVKIKFDLETAEYQLSKFVVILGGDSRKERIEIENNEFYDYTEELQDMYRESVGMRSLDKYDYFLEEHLSCSKMKEEIVNRFETINALKSNFEDVIIAYEDIIEVLKKKPDEAKKKIPQILEKTDEITDVSFDMEDDDVSDVLEWIEERYREIANISCQENLPDDIVFGDRITFCDAEENVYTLDVDEINIKPSEGGEEYIYIRLFNNSAEYVKQGYVKLTVGYLNHDEDGGIADGLSDDIEYYYEKIINEMDDVIDGLNKLLEKHNKLKVMLQDII